MFTILFNKSITTQLTTAHLCLYFLFQIDYLKSDGVGLIAVHSKIRIPLRTQSFNYFRMKLSRFTSLDFDVKFSLFFLIKSYAMHFYSQHVIIAIMKNHIVTRAFQNLFQLNTQPIYVTCDAPQEENLLNSQIEEQNKKNTCPSMYSALCILQPDGVIKVGNGLYTQNIEIKVPGARIQTAEPGTNPILASEKFPTIIIDLPQKEDKVFMEGLRFAHLCDYDKEILKWPTIKQLRANRYRGLKTGDNMNASILLKRGTLQIDQCRLSFSGQRDPNHIFPIIAVEEEGSLILARSELIGGIGSVGVYCNGGKVNIRQCSFRDHAAIGVLMTGGRETSLVFKNSTISSCGDGIVLNGPFVSSVQNNNIVQCSSSGITTLFGNTSNLINNQIGKCKMGLEIQNSLPKVMKNNFIKNIQFGCSIYSKMYAECKPHLRFNLFSQNIQGGILVSGGRNRTQIFNNVITYNQKVGIKVQNNAHPHIFLNEVSKNFGNGVHLRGGGTAFIEKNEISGSTNCNLVLQGPNNIDNYVYNNHISDARGQGLLLAYCEKFLIAKNVISHNYNGILAVTSVVNVQDNHIAENKCNGVILVDDCQILLTQNHIEGNRRAGVVARNTSTARMRQNKFGDNKIDLLVQRGWDTLREVEKQNEFAKGADIRVPGNLCALI